MGIRSLWGMKDPVPGVFRVSDRYSAHPHSSSPGTMLTGVIIADGLAPTPAEAEVPQRGHGKWQGREALPVTVDRANPSKFRIEWDQLVKQDPQAIARQRAQDQATRLAGGESAIGTPLAQTPQVDQQDQFAQFGGLAGSIGQALRSAGISPEVMNSHNMTVRQFDVAGSDQMRAMMDSFFGNQGNPGNNPTVQFTQFGTAGPTTPATGVVREVHDVAPPVPLPSGMSQVDITLDVSRPDGSTYPATTRIGFSTPARRAAVATVGTTLPLLVDQNDPGRLSVDVARMNLP
ncbi:MAG TPA: hypothetical protein VGD84_11005 [Pseudonocardiaceae bacterium]